ncbi:MAG: hypothetical protein V4631_02390 [Pseudomonadota bacterium]
MSQSKNSAFSVSNIVYPLPKWRYFVLFQSWTQLQSYLLIVLACTLAIHGLALVSGARVMPIGVLLAGLAAGGLISVALVLKARLTVSPASEEAVRRVVTEVECARYIENGVQGNAIIYRQNLPRLLRWQEGNISVARDGDQLIISGPVASLKRIRSHLVA